MSVQGNACFLLGLVLVQLAGLFAGAGDVRADVPNVLQDDPIFVEGWQGEIDKQIELLIAAYGLDADAEKNLRTELELRLVLERDYETKMMAELDQLGRKVQEAGAGDDENSPELLELGRRLSELTNGMPLNENQVADWVATRVSPDMAQEGRQRWEELVQRRKNKEGSKFEEDNRVSGRKAELAAEVREMRAPGSDGTGQPLPRGDNGDFAREETLRKMGRPYINPADIAAARERSRARENNRAPSAKGHGGYPTPGMTSPDQTGAASNSAIAASPGNSHLPSPPEPLRLNAAKNAAGQPSSPPQPAPPLDEWEKYVVSVSQKYGFDDGQNTRAQSILSDLRKRAYQYQLSRSEEYARAQLMTEAKARTESLNRLNAPLDALFAELKQRLESLPTMAQKQRQGQPTPHKK